MVKICFVEAMAYSVLNSKSGRSSTGGESVQHTLLAKGFAQAGWQTSMISLDVGQSDGDVVDGVQVWKTYKRTAGFPYLRFLYPRMYSIWRALNNADADVYFQSCAGLMTGVVAKFVERKNRNMIFRVAHDTDCIPGEQLIKTARDRRLYEYGLKAAGLISVQSATQSNALAENYQLDSVGVDMVAEIPEVAPDSERDIDVLWVNNFRKFKRPELVLEIAKRLPDVSFAIVGGHIRGFEALYRDIREEAKSLPNLEFVGAVPYSEVNSYFSRAKLFLNTSDTEGFPNSFLQAWVRCVPVVSYFDPDGLIQSRDFGVAVPSQENFHDSIRELLSMEDRRRDIGRRTRQFVIDRYSPASIVSQYESLISDRFGVSL